MTHAPKSFLISLSPMLGWLLMTVACGLLGTGEMISALRGLWPVLTLFNVFLCLLVCAFLLIRAYFKKKTTRWLWLTSAGFFFTLLLVIRSMNYWPPLHFKLYRSHYQNRVSQILQADSFESRKRLCGDECWISQTEPPQIRFRYSYFFINWTDFAYDPAGELSEQAIRQRYGYLNEVRPLGGSWYAVYSSD